MSNADMDAIYARVSTGQQEKENTIGTQLSTIAQRFGPEGRSVYATYTDNGYPGDTMTRPALNALRAAAAAGHFNRLLVDHPDRLSRGKAWELECFEYELEHAGVKVCYASYEKQDTEAGQIVHTIMAHLSHMEHANIKRRTSAGIARKLERHGVWRTRKTLGWLYVPPKDKGRDGHFEIVPEEAKLVREIFDRVLRGETAYAVAAVLNARGERTSTGGHWTGDAVRRTIHTTLHSGRVSHNAHESVKPARPRDIYTAQLKRSSRTRPRTEWEYHEIPVRIVTPEQQEQAIAQLGANKKCSKRNATHHYLLSGLICCGYDLPYEPGVPCGRKLVGAAKKNGYRYYRCTRKLGGDPHIGSCCKGTISANVVERKVWEEIARLASDPNILIIQKLNEMGVSSDRRTRLTAQLGSAKARQAKYQDALTKLTTMYALGNADDTTFAESQAQLVLTRDSAAEEAAHIEQELAQADDSQALLLRAAEYFLAVKEELATLTTADDDTAFATKRKRITAMVTAVTLCPDGQLRVELLLPVVENDGSGAVVQSRPGCIETRIPSYARFNTSASSGHAGFRFSLMIAA